MDKEYLILREEIVQNLKKQDQVFGTIISLLGLTNIFSSYSENVLFLFLILLLSTFLQLRMLEYRNTVYYISTYMVAFLERDSEFKWETRLRLFKKDGYGYENGNPGKKVISKLVFQWGRKFKHFLILGLVIFILVRIIINVYKSQYALWIKVALYIIAGLLVGFNILYTYTLGIDKLNYEVYLKRWERIRIQEQENTNPNSCKGNTKTE